VVSPEGWLTSIVCSFCPQGRLQLGSVIAHYQFVQVGEICCCFFQVAAELLHS
jgi:hypothetical protein